MSITEKITNYFASIHLDQYTKDKSALDRVEKRVIYAFGPLLVFRDAFSKIVDRLSTKFNDLSLMSYCAAIIKVTTKNSCKEIKNSLREVVVESDKKIEDKSIKSIIQNKVKSVMESIRDFQYKNKVLENVVLDVAPIVPYAGEVKKQWNDVSDGEITNEELTRSYASYFLSLLIDKSGYYVKYEDLLSRLLKLNVFFIIKNVEYLVNDPREIPIRNDITTNTICTDADRLLIVDEDKPRDASVKAYYFFAYCYCYNIPPDIVIVYLSNIKNITNSNKMKKEEIDKIISSMGNDYIEEEPYLMTQEGWDELSYYNNKKIEKLVEDSYTEEEKRNMNTYDVNRLFSYIFNHRYINTDEYTNMTFMDRIKEYHSISNVSYYQNFTMSCVIDDKFLVVPYLNIAKDYKLFILCMDKYGNIWSQEDLRKIENRSMYYNEDVTIDNPNDDEDDDD